MCACGVWRKRLGFSLIELMTALSVTTVLLTVGVPNLRDFVLNQRRTAAINELITAIQMARGEAYKRGQTVTICPSADPTAAAPVCSTTGSDWTKGWLMYANLDESMAGTEPDPGETVIKASTNDYSAVSIGASFSGGAGNVSMSLRRFGAASTNGTVTFCDSRGASNASERRAIIVSPTGRPRTSTVASDGSPLTCP